MAEPPKRERSFKNYTLTVESTENLSPTIKQIRFRLAPGEEIHFQAGQFIQVVVPLPDGKVRRTAYSIASPPSQKNFFDLVITLVPGGRSSTYLHGLKVGDTVQAMGPLGAFQFVEEGRDAVFIATGSCIAPFRAMIPDQIEKGARRNLFLLFGNRTKGDILYREEWEKLAAQNHNLKTLFTLSRENWEGPKGYVQDHIGSFVPDPTAKVYYICGLKKMIHDVEERLLSLGVPKNQIRFERFD